MSILVYEVATPLSVDDHHFKENESSFVAQLLGTGMRFTNCSEMLIVLHELDRPDILWFIR